MKDSTSEAAHPIARRGMMDSLRPAAVAERLRMLPGSGGLQLLRRHLLDVGRLRVAGDRLAEMMVGILADALDVADQFPDHVGRQGRAPGRHAVGAALVDREVDVGGLVTVDPFVVAERRPHATGPVGGVTADAIEVHEMLHAALYGARIAFERILDIDW